MPLNRNGTPEIRELFASVDKLSSPPVAQLVSPDGAHLTERGQKVQRNYVNWRAKKLVPKVLRNFPPQPGDAEYVARFLKLTDGKWLPNHATVLHIFAEGRLCPSEPLRETLRAIAGPLHFVDSDDPEGIAPEDLVSAVLSQIQSDGRGNKKHWRETQEGKRARLFENILLDSPAAPSVNQWAVDEEEKDQEAMKDPGPAIAQILAPLIAGLLGQDVDPSLFDIDADLAEPILFSSLLAAAGIDPTDIPDEVQAEHGQHMKQTANVIGRAIRRLDANPESISASIKEVHVLLVAGAKCWPALAAQLSIRADSDEPRDHAFLDCIIIFAAAYVTEKAASD
jgi:hypothetical protein